MKKDKIITFIIMLVGIVGISLLVYYEKDNTLSDLSKFIDISSFKIGDITTNAKPVKDNNSEKSNVNDLFLSEFAMETVPASVIIKEKSYDEMSLDELNVAIHDGTLKMEYSAFYTNSSARLSKSKGAQYFNGHKETYYSERVLPGTSLNIPGRHAADDGTIRDGEGYICVAADPSFMPKGSILITSLGPAKVYDSGCAYGTIDLYVNW